MKYFINIDSFDCSWRLFINDIPVFDLRRGGNFNADICINKFMVNGKNEVSCLVKPFPGIEKIPTTAYLKFNIYTGDSPKNNKVNIKEIKTPEFTETEDAPLPSEHKLADSFSGNGIADSLIQSGEILRDTPELRRELINKYDEIWGLFESKNIAAIKDVFFHRDTELSVLESASLSELTEDTEDDYSTYMNNSELELWAINREKLDFKLYFKGKLACYELKNGNSPLCFVNNIEKYAIYIPMFFSRNVGSKDLIVIR